MKVKKRDGRLEEVSFDKISHRIKTQCYGLNPDYIDHITIAKKVIQGLYDGVTTEELDNLAAETAASMATIHPDYTKLAARICISNLHKTTCNSFSESVKILYNYVNPKTGKKGGLISDETYRIVCENEDVLDSAIIHDRDFSYDYFGFKTLERAYLLKADGKVVERPQHMIMRVAVGIHGDDIQSALNTYHLMSEKYFTHATPTLFNAGTNKPQLSSCFLLKMQEDSITGIFDTLKQCALISQHSGGIGLSIHEVRGNGSYIRGTGGTSSGIVPMLRVFNDTARYVDQSGKRKGSFAIYLEPWHPDVFDFLELKKNHGKEEHRARDLFYAMWIPDLFMERVENNETWSLFCPDECPGLNKSYGEEFNQLYLRYEREGRAKKTVKAQDIWFAICESQIETGTPYMSYKDAVNKKSNQKNLGTIESSNLCQEVMQFTDKDEVAVCNLASIAVNMFVKDGQFDFIKLYEVTRTVTRNLNRVIDVNYYPVKEAETSNLRHRPIGIGVQGLADAFALLRLPFDSEAARKLNSEIFETMYYASVSESVQLAKEEGTYESYEGSPISKGILQFDMWNVTPTTRWDWASLKQEIKLYGVRNSLLLAPMPTASCILKTSEIITSDGVKSYEKIFDEQGINHLEIERTNDQQWVFFENPIKVLTRNGYEEVEKAFYNGHKEVYDIEMEDGTIFIATANHRFLVVRNNSEEWVRVDELSEEDEIVTAVGIEV